MEKRQCKQSLETRHQQRWSQCRARMLMGGDGEGRVGEGRKVLECQGKDLRIWPCAQQGARVFKQVT